MTATLGTHVLRDLDVEALADAFQPATAGGRTELVARLSNPVSTLDISKRQDAIRSLKRVLTDPLKRDAILGIRATLRGAEEDVRTMSDLASDSRHAEYYNQVLWPPKSVAAPLNRHGWFTEAMVFFRSVFLPGLAVILPIFVFLAPLLVYAFVLKEPLDLNKYFAMLSTSLKKAMPSVLGKPRFAGKGGALEIGEQFLHIAVSAGVFVASIWNQISAALSLRRIADDMRRRADAVKRLSAAVTEYDRLVDAGAGSVDSGGWGGTAMDVFGRAWNMPEDVGALLARAAAIDADVSLALQRRTCFATFGDVSGGLAIERMWHPGTGGRRVYNSVTMGSPTGARRHILLTGPNRGGKSTLLKSLGSAVLMAHTVGIVFAKKAHMPAFDTIITALAPADVIGKMSLFEAEIEFAKDVKAQVAREGAGPMFLMMDEIFHGTNAHDGVEASQVFLDDLYGVSGSGAGASIFSVVSTHYMNLPERYGKEQTQNLCMDAKQDPADPDRLVYTYRLCEGVNRFSSVREILRERGLLAQKTSPSLGKE